MSNKGILSEKRGERGYNGDLIGQTDITFKILKCLNDYSSYDSRLHLHEYYTSLP